MEPSRASSPDVGVAVPCQASIDLSRIVARLCDYPHVCSAISFADGAYTISCEIRNVPESMVAVLQDFSVGDRVIVIRGDLYNARATIFQLNSNFAELTLVHDPSSSVTLPKTDIARDVFYVGQR